MIENNYEIIKYFVKDTKGSECRENFKNGREWSFDLTVGDEYFISGDNLPSKLSSDEPYIIIKPGQFAILETKETVELDGNHMALINVKFTFKKRGLINISGFHVDPLYRGKIIFTVFNAGPNDIYIKKDEYVFMIFFIELSKPIAGKEIKEIKEGYEGVPKDMFANLGGGALTLMQYNKKIEQLEFYMKVIVIPIALLLLGLLLQELLSIGK